MFMIHWVRAVRTITMHILRRMASSPAHTAGISADTCEGSKINAIRSTASPVRIGRYSVRATDITAMRMVSATRTPYGLIYLSTFTKVSFCLVFFFSAFIYFAPLSCFFSNWL